MPVPVHRAVHRQCVLVSCYNSDVMIQTVDESADVGSVEPALLSVEALAEDWLRPEEDEAWSRANLS